MDNNGYIYIIFLPHIFSNNSYCINNEKIKSICKKYLNKLEEIKNV